MEANSDDKTLRIEIRQPSTLESGNITINGSAKDGPRAYVSAEQVMRLISGRNVELLRLIKERRPQSLAELSRISGRPTASLTRTLQRLSALGIVRMDSSRGREKIPVVVCDMLRFDLPLTA